MAGYDDVINFYTECARVAGITPTKSFYTSEDEPPDLKDVEFSFNEELSENLYAINIASYGVRVRARIGLQISAIIQIDSKQSQIKTFRQKCVNLFLYAINPKNFGACNTTYEDLLKSDLASMSIRPMDDEQVTYCDLIFEIEYKIADSPLLFS